MVAKLLPLLCECQTYVEPFGGGASLLFAKPPSPVEVYNDLDEGLVRFYRVLRDPELFERFRCRIELTPYARAEYDWCRDTWQECDDEVERAARWFTVARQSFAGQFGTGWGRVITASNRGMGIACAAWLSAVDRLPAVHERLQRVQIECQDWRTILTRYDTPETLFYVDPPYIPETRSAGGYAHELTDDDHRELVERLLGLEGRAMLSGYPHQIYQPLEDAGWDRREWQTASHAAARTKATGIQGAGSMLEKQPRTEVAWRNYRVQGRLF